MTPLQMAMVAATIANDGVVMQPYVVDEIVAPGRATVVARREPERLGRAVSPRDGGRRSTAMMEAAVAGGTGDGGADPRRRASPARPAPPRRAARASTRVAFIGFAPADEPARRRRGLRRGAARRGRRRRPRRSRRQVMQAILGPGVEHVDPYPVGAHGRHRHPDRHALRRALPDPAQARRAAGWPTSTSPRTRSSAAASRSRSSTSATRATSSSSSASAARRKSAAGAVAPEHRLDLRPRRGRGHLLHRDGAPRRAQPQGAHRRARPGAGADRDRVRAPDPRRARASRTGTGSSTATSSRTTCSSTATAA